MQRLSISSVCEVRDPVLSQNLLTQKLRSLSLVAYSLCLSNFNAFCWLETRDALPSTNVGDHCERNGKTGSWKWFTNLMTCSRVVCGLRMRGVVMILVGRYGVMDPDGVFFYIIAVQPTPSHCHAQATTLEHAQNVPTIGMPQTPPERYGPEHRNGVI